MLLFGENSPARYFPQEKLRQILAKIKALKFCFVLQRVISLRRLAAVERHALPSRAPGQDNLL